jgi:hypothetical protein
MRENNNSKVQLHFFTYQGNLTQNKTITDYNSTILNSVTFTIHFNLFNCSNTKTRLVQKLQVKEN